MALQMIAQGSDELYSRMKVLNIIKNYHSNLCYTQEVLDRAVKSVGVAQYGIEAAMPKSKGGHSSQTENQAIKSLYATKNISKKLTDMKYLQDRLYRIDDEKDAIIIYSVMQGKSYTETAQMIGCDRSLITKRMENIVDKICGV